jgi:hypothetical protein
MSMTAVRYESHCATQTDFFVPNNFSILLTNSFQMLGPLSCSGDSRQKKSQQKNSRQKAEVVTTSLPSVHPKPQDESLHAVQRPSEERKNLQNRKAAMQREAEIIEGERAILRDSSAAVHRNKRLAAQELEDLAEQRRTIHSEREALRARERELLRQVDADAAALAEQHDARILAGARAGTLPPAYAAALAGALVPSLSRWLEASVECFACLGPVDLDCPDPSARWVACCDGGSFACAACVPLLRASHLLHPLLLGSHLLHPLAAERAPALQAAAARARFGIRRSPGQPCRG